MDSPETGPYTYSKRSIPYLENPVAYHSEIFNRETYFDKIDAIRDGDLSKLNDILESEGIGPFSDSEFDKLKFGYDNYVESTTSSLGLTKDEVLYGIHGKAAPWGDMSGGAEQIATPFNGNIMENLGILKEN